MIWTKVRFTFGATVYTDLHQIETVKLLYEEEITTTTNRPI